MADARSEILRRIRAALRDVPAGEGRGQVPVPREYAAGPGAVDPAAVVDRFVERVADYRATVARVPADGVAAAVRDRLLAAGATRVVVPADLPASWRPDGVECVADSPDLGHADLDACSAVVTGAAVGIAQTGTLVLDGGPHQGRRAATLLPDHHVCVVLAEQVVDGVPEALARLQPTRPLTFVSGPSATSDIELDRVEGVHGPRRLDVLVVEPAPPAPEAGG